MIKKGLLFFVFVIAIVFVILFFLKIPQKIYYKDSFLTPIAVSKKNISDISPTSIMSQSALKNLMDHSLAETNGTYGIVIKNLKTNKMYSKNEHVPFESASLYKLWVMATVFDQLQKEKLHEDDILTQNVETLNNEFDISSEAAELTDGVITLSVADALNKMITFSDNYPALLLSEKVGLSNVEKFLINHSLNESILGEPPKTTASDIALFLEKLYNAELANSTYSEEMMDLLKNQTLNNKLPKYLPENVIIAHKTGEINFLTHDAGIVFGKHGDYIFVVLSETDAPADAEEKIATISKSVYDYFESNP